LRPGPARLARADCQIKPVFLTGFLARAPAWHHVHPGANSDFFLTEGVYEAAEKLPLALKTFPQRLKPR